MDQLRKIDVLEGSTLEVLHGIEGEGVQWTPFLCLFSQLIHTHNKGGQWM